MNLIEKAEIDINLKLNVLSKQGEVFTRYLERFYPEISIKPKERGYRELKISIFRYKSRLLARINKLQLEYSIGEELVEDILGE